MGGEEVGEWKGGGREDGRGGGGRMVGRWKGRMGGGGIDGRERTIYVRKVFMQLKVCS